MDRDTAWNNSKARAEQAGIVFDDGLHRPPIYFMTLEEYLEFSVEPSGLFSRGYSKEVATEDYVDMLAFALVHGQAIPDECLQSVEWDELREPITFWWEELLSTLED